MYRKPDTIISLLKKRYPGLKSPLEFSSRLELLVSVILSARSTDRQVNSLTMSLFKKYRTVSDYAHAKPKIFSRDIRSIGFYNNKAKNIIAAAKKIIVDFNGRIPGSMPELLQLPGVGRKTANIVLFKGFKKTEGIAVDTHVLRVSRRLGLTKNNNPDKVEQDLMNFFSKKNWGIINRLFIEHGRKTCRARNPRCSFCVLGRHCPSKKYFLSLK